MNKTLSLILNLNINTYKINTKSKEGMQSTEVHEKKLQTDLQGGSGGRKSAR